LTPSGSGVTRTYGICASDRAGVYVNFLDSDDDASRVREAYCDDTYRRLAEVKAKYDPENVFQNNKNIQPDAPAL
jgi:FAD/FMN-containing dehydrogenase